MLAYLFLPKKGSPPYQTVILFPGSGAINRRSSEPIMEERNDRIVFFLKSGRAFLYPVLKGTYERGDALRSDYPDETSFYKDHVIMWVKDFSRSIDYLETCEDIDASKLAYYGTSWGGQMGGIVPAIEPRFVTSVLEVEANVVRGRLGRGPFVDAHRRSRSGARTSLTDRGFSCPYWFSFTFASVRPRMV